MNDEKEKIVTGGNTKSRRKLPSKKKLLVAGLVVLAVALAAFFIFRDREPVGKEIIEGYETTKKAALAPSGIDPSKDAELSGLINAEKYAEARALIESLQKEEALTEFDKQMLASKKAFVCENQQDIACLVELFEASNEFDFYRALVVARIAKQRGDNSTARSYYQKVKQHVDSKGGEPYINELNQSAQEQVNYAEISEGAQ